MKVDNFALVNFRSCKAKYDLRMRQGWVPRQKSPALYWGGLMHLGLAEWYRSGDPILVLDTINQNWPKVYAYDDWRTRDKALKTMAEYMQQYPAETFAIVGRGTSVAVIERTFTIETGLFCQCQKCLSEDDQHTISGMCALCGAALEPIEYGGIFDAAVEFSGTVYVLEHKTTSRLGSFYFDQFKPNNQVTGYIWAASKLTGKRVAGAIINAIGIYKASATKFERHITSRSELEVTEWLRSVKRTCDDIKRYERLGEWPLETHSCTIYGKCEYHDVHVLANEKDRQKRLEQDYVKAIWDYEQRDDEPQGVTD